MFASGLFEVYIATHQRGSSGIDYRAIHKQMEEHGFERVIQTTAQSANEVPGVYRLGSVQLTIQQVTDMVRGALEPLGRDMSVRVVKVEEEVVFDLASALPSGAGADLLAARRRYSKHSGEAQSGYPAWRRPR